MLRFIETEERWTGEPINDIRHPRNIEQLWSAAELAKIGLERYTPPKPEPVPADPMTLAISRFQFKIALGEAGLAQVRKALAATADADTRHRLTIGLTDREYFLRDDPLIGQIVTALGLTKKQADALWNRAVEVQP